MSDMPSASKYRHQRPLGHGRVDADAAPVKPRDAATMILWREGPDGVEVLMGRRSRRAAFVPDFFVFPGGRLDAADRAVAPATRLHTDAVGRMAVRDSAPLAEALAVTAVRETFEETGLLLAETGDVGASADAGWDPWRTQGLAPGLSRLRYFGRAITSPTSPIRFHARFFITPAQAVRGELAGSGELSDLAYYPVAEVLARMPIVDVTEFMLNRVIAYAAAGDDIPDRTPLFSYKADTAVVRYER
jgi:8-oxo-dGTP pyrophosphatase MutT (NUDIX family)